MRIRDWIKSHTQIWDEEHEELAMEIAVKLVWYKPTIRKRILKRVEEFLEKRGKII
jgi:hypothetical protein